MRVAFYNHTSEVSGAEINLLLIAKKLRTAEPIIFAPEGELLNLALESGLQVVCIPSYRARLSKEPLQLLKGILGMLWAGLKFARTLGKHRIDIIHANSLRSGIMAALFVWLHRCPLIWHVQDIPPSGIIGKAINKLTQYTVKAVIGISNSVLHGFDRRKLADKMYLVHNGVELQEISEFEKWEIKKRIREELHTPFHSRLVVIIGQITPWKRQIDAILAAKELLSRGHDIYLWVVGEAKFREDNKLYEESLHHLADQLVMKDRVRFTGFRTDVMEICCAADLLFLCSENEPFGRVIIEAMSQSIPVVATNGGGVPEIIEHEHCGLLYKIGDIEGLVQCADRLLSNKNLRQRMGSLAAERVKDYFTIQSAVAKIENVYRSVLSHTKPIEIQYAKEKEFS
jgi:glycosyltransferase involved in cell wall biosynthesis